MNAVIVASMVVVSALLPSKASTISDNPELLVSSPIVICGSSRRSLENPGSRNPSPVPVEVEGGHVEQDQKGRAQSRMSRAGRGELVPPLLGGLNRQPAVQRGIPDRLDPDLAQHPQAVLLTGRLDDPRQH